MTPEETAAHNNGLIIGAVMAGHFYAPKAWRCFDVIETRDAISGYVRGVFVKPDIVVAKTDQMIDGNPDGLFVKPDIIVSESTEVDL